MTVKYRAVHTGKPWRRVGVHKTVQSAMEAPDGARNLLLRVGRVGKKWEQYGDVLAVFVWEDGPSQGQVFRLRPGTSAVVESATVPASERSDEGDRPEARPRRGARRALA